MDRSRHCLAFKLPERDNVDKSVMEFNSPPEAALGVDGGDDLDVQPESPACDSRSGRQRNQPRNHRELLNLLVWKENMVRYRYIF